MAAIAQALDAEPTEAIHEAWGRGLAFELGGLTRVEIYRAGRAGTGVLRLENAQEGVLIQLHNVHEPHLSREGIVFEFPANPSVLLSVSPQGEAMLHLVPPRNRSRLPTAVSDNGTPWPAEAPIIAPTLQPQPEGEPRRGELHGTLLTDVTIKPHPKVPGKRIGEFTVSETDQAADSAGTQIDNPVVKVSVFDKRQAIDRLQKLVQAGTLTPGVAVTLVGYPKLNVWTDRRGREHRDRQFHAVVVSPTSPGKH